MSKKIIAAFMLTIGCSGAPFEAADFHSDSNTYSDTDGGTGGSSTTVETGGASGAGGAHNAAGGVRSEGGAHHETGGTVASTGGVSSGGDTSTGGVTDDGGIVAAGGAGSGGDLGSGGSGGIPQEMDGGCRIVTHDNGLGQTWQDCVPLGTYNETQATKACEASGAPRCSAAGSSASSPSMVCGYNTSGGYAGGCWGYADASTGHVVAADAAGSVPITTGSWR